MMFTALLRFDRIWPPEPLWGQVRAAPSQLPVRSRMLNLAESMTVAAH